MAVRDWRSPSAYASTLRLDRAGFAWEFLRRNPLYQRDFAQIRESASGQSCVGFPLSWGLRFPADPERSAREQPVYWSAQALPSVLRLTTAPWEPAAASLASPKIFDTALARAGDDGLHLLWRLDDADIRVWADDPAQAKAAPVIMLPLDSALELRARTAIRLWRLLNTRPAGPDAAPMPPGRRGRLVAILRVLDARKDHASLRDIAEALFRQRIVGRAWQGSSLHVRTKRLVRSGVALVQGGYRKLLNPPPRRRRGRGDAEPTP